ALAGCGIALTEGQRSDIRVGNGNLLVRVFGVKPNGRIGQGFAAATVKDVAFHFAPVLAGDGHVAAIIEGLLKSLTNLFLASQRGNPSFQFFMGEAGNHFQRVRGFLELIVILSSCSRVGAGATRHARVSSSSPAAVFFWICTSGL